MRLDRGQMVWGSIFGGVILVFVAGLWWPASHKINKLQTEIVKTEHDLGIVRGRTNGHAILKVQVDDLRKRVASNRKVISPAHEASALLGELSLMIETAELTDQTLSSLKNEVDDGVTASPVELTFRGNSVRVFDFVRRVEQMPRMLHIDALEIELDPEVGEVEAKVSLTTYFSGEEGSGL